MTARPDSPSADASGAGAADDDGFVPLARLAEIPPGGLLGARTPDGAAVCLSVVKGAVCALRDVCSHQAFPLSAGDLTADGAVQCAWHGARFDARTGAVRGAPACEPVPAFDVRLVDGMVYVRPSRDTPPPSDR